MRSNLYIGIAEQLQNVNNSNGETVFRHIDLWNQNVEFIEQETFDVPAVFIEFMPIQWKTLGQGVQQAELTVRLHIVTRWVAPTNMQSIAFNEAIAYLDIPNFVVKQMQNVVVPGANGFVRKSSTINHNHGEIIDSTEDYATLITDYSAMRELAPVKANSVFMNE